MKYQFREHCLANIENLPNINHKKLVRLKILRLNFIYI